MTGSISKFKSSFNKDPARASRFDVIIPNPKGLNVSGLNSTFRCEIAQLPGRNFSTMEQKTYGPIEKFPYWSNYNDIDLTFIVDDSMSVKSIFDIWMDYINPSANFNFKYKDDYSVDIVISQYDVTGNKTYTATLYRAFPINMNQLDLDWSSDAVHKLVVTFAYTYWE